MKEYITDRISDLNAEYSGLNRMYQRAPIVEQRALKCRLEVLQGKIAELTHFQNKFNLIEYAI